MGRVEGGKPMTLLVLAACLIAPTQDDPAVLYREGLFEEIDQGNLEKAQALYGRVLKSNADGALKARALYRRGSCLEKSGKRKDAEQVYRDVQERFPEQAELLRLAQGRLSAMSGGGPAQGYSPEAEVPQLILDLGTHETVTRAKAIHRLILIGSAALPDVKRALAHKDRLLSAGAAVALVTLEPGEGMYEALLRSPELQDLRSLAKLFGLRPEDKERFIKDAETLPADRFSYLVSVAGKTLQDPRLLRVVEDRILKEGKAPDDRSLTGIWWNLAKGPQIPAFVQRLLKEGGPRHYALFALLIDPRVTFSSEPYAAEVSRALRDGLVDLAEPSGDWVSILRNAMTPTDLIRGLFDSWIRSPDPKRRLKAAGGVEHLRGKEFVEYTFDVLASEDYADDVKDLFFRNTSEVQKVAEGKQKEQLLKYYLGLLKKEGAPNDDLRGVVGGASHREYVFRNLSEEAPEWGWLFDQEMKTKTIVVSPKRHLDDRLKASDRLRHLYVEAAHRALTSDSADVRKRGWIQFDLFATPAERRTLAKVLPAIPESQVQAAVRTLVRGYWPLTPEEWAVELKEVAPLFKSPSVAIRRNMAAEFSTQLHAPLDAVMKEALADPDVQVRRSALTYWSNRRVPEAIPLMIEGLRDPDDENKHLAIAALGNSPSIDAVPPLLGFLRSTNAVLRGAAQTSLKAIQQYYDEQEQWRKWYEDVKSRLPKEK
jgi:tetratricopeptide (TPR) repeat protein